MKTSAKRAGKHRIAITTFHIPIGMRSKSGVKQRVFRRAHVGVKFETFTVYPFSNSVDRKKTARWNRIMEIKHRYRRMLYEGRD